MDIFVGVPQSKYAGASILISLIAVSIAILVGRDSIPLSQKFAFVLMIFLVSLPGLLMTLFQLTCLVTGTDKGKNTWCNIYSWFVAGLLVVYSVILVTISVLSLASGGKVLDDITRADIEFFQVKSDRANKAARALFTDAPSTAPSKPDVEGTLAGSAPPKVVPPSAPSMIASVGSGPSGITGMDASQGTELMPIQDDSPVTPARNAAFNAVMPSIPANIQAAPDVVDAFDDKEQGFSDYVQSFASPNDGLRFRK